MQVAEQEAQSQGAQMEGSSLERTAMSINLSFQTMASQAAAGISGLAMLSNKSPLYDELKVSSRC